MIKPILFLILLLTCTFRANAQNERSYIDSVRNHRYVIFSWTGTPTREISRYRDQINNHFSRIDYEVLDSLYRSETGVLQFYAFIVICKKFPGMINSEHKKMLNTKDQIMVLTASQTKPSMLPKKDIAATLYKDAMGVLDAQKKLKKQYNLSFAIMQNFQSHINRFHLINSIC